MLVARIDVKTTNPLNGSQTTTKVGAMLKRKEHRRQHLLAVQAMEIASLRQPTRDVVLVVKEWFSQMQTVWSLADMLRLDRKRMRVAVVLRRVAPGTRPMDSGALGAAMKWVQDGIAEFFGVDDADKNFDWRYEQRRGRKGEYAVEVELP